MKQDHTLFCQRRSPRSTTGIKFSVLILIPRHFPHHQQILGTWTKCQGVGRHAKSTSEAPSRFTLLLTDLNFQDSTGCSELEIQTVNSAPAPAGKDNSTPHVNCFGLFSTLKYSPVRLYCKTFVRFPSLKPSKCKLFTLEPSLHFGLLTATSKNLAIK